MRLWNDVFVAAQEALLPIPRGTIRATTVLIETLPAAFEMEEILYELRDHASGLNAGRWDYIFSFIESSATARFALPERVRVTMTVPPCARANELLVKELPRPRCATPWAAWHRSIPSRKNPEINAAALA